MNSKIIVLIAAFSLIQENHASTVSDVTAELAPKIAAVKIKIDLTIQNGAKLIRETRKSIGQTITNAETQIHSQLDQLDNLIQEAEQEAQQKGGDVSQCVNDVTVGLSDFDPERLQNCSSNRELDLLGTKLGYLRYLKKNVSRSINVCLGKNSEDLDGLRVCVQSDIDSAQVKIDGVQTEMNSVCKRAEELVSVCIEVVVKELDKVVDKVAHDLKNCLSKIL